MVCAVLPSGPMRGHLLCRLHHQTVGGGRLLLCKGTSVLVYYLRIRAYWLCKGAVHTYVFLYVVPVYSYILGVLHVYVQYVQYLYILRV